MGAHSGALAANGEKQLFAPVPLRAMAADLSGLQLRVLVCVAAHDRMSLVTGKGQGCRASNERMKQMVGCNFSRLCSTLSQLVDLRLLEKEKLGRHTVYRVIYTEDDRLLFGNMSPSSTGCRATSKGKLKGCRDFLETDGFPPETSPQYIPLNGGRDSVETGKENSSEEARFAARRLGRVEFSENAGGQMARLERALSVGEVVDRLGWCEWLETQIGADDNANNSGRAARLAEQLVEQLDDAEYRAWGETHGWVDEDGQWHASHPRAAVA